jgi:hypothetical protein
LGKSSEEEKRPRTRNMEELRAKGGWKCVQKTLKLNFEDISFAKVGVITPSLLPQQDSAKEPEDTSVAQLPHPSLLTYWKSLS